MWKFVRYTGPNAKEKGWVAIDDTVMQDPKDYQHSSVYLYRDKLENGEDYRKVPMKGSFFLDIDYKAEDGGIPAAIDAVRRVLKVLESWGVNLGYVNIWASGGKGFHIEVPQKLFAKDQALQFLNVYHHYLAIKLGELSEVKLDPHLYAARHTVRVPGKREDGRWKVPVTAVEVMDMTEEDYHKVCSGPRPNGLAAQQIVHKDYCAQGMAQQWAHAREEGKRHVARQAAIPALNVEYLNVFSDEKLPRCIELMREGGSEVTGNYNDVSMQFGAFLGSAANLSETARERLLEGFARANKSDSKSLNARIAHTQTVVSLAKAGSFNFSCGGCRKVLSTNPCSGCPVKEKKEEAAQAVSSIAQGDDGLYLKNADGQGTRITNFLMSKAHSVCTSERGGRMRQADTVSITSWEHGVEVHTEITIPSEDWVSLAAFKRTIQKAPGALVLTSMEAVLPLIQMFLDSIESCDMLMKVDRLGIHIYTHPETGLDRPVWVEPGWSLDNAGVASGYTYEGFAADSAMSLRGLLTPKGSDTELNDILLRLMDSNRPYVVGHALGWSSACHLKEHLYRIGRREFPLLHITGLKGSGKSHSAVVYAAITGTRLEGGPMTVEGGTTSPVRQALSQTTTIARAFDEFNVSGMGPDKYQKLVGYLKSAYFRQNLQVGLIAKTKLGQVGAATSDEYATAPVIFMGKEATNSEELIQRSVVVNITESAHYEGNYAENFSVVFDSLSDLNPEGHPLRRLCRLLVTTALGTSPDQCREWYQEIQADLPPNKHSRTRNNLFVIRLGLKFLGLALNEFPEETKNRLKELDRLVVQSWQEAETEEQKKQAFGAPEKLLECLAEMATISEDARTPGRFTPGHYVRVGNKLWISTVAAYQHYLPYARYMNRRDIEISSAASLYNLFKERPYCLGEMGPPGRPNARNWFCLDLSQLEGIDTDVFEQL